MQECNFPPKMQFLIKVFLKQICWMRKGFYLRSVATPNISKPFRGCLFIEQLSEGALLLFHSTNIPQDSSDNLIYIIVSKHLHYKDWLPPTPPHLLPMCHCCEWLDFDVHWVKHMILGHVEAVAWNHVWTTKQGRLFGNCGPSTRSLSLPIWQPILLSETDVMDLNLQQHSGVVLKVLRCRSVANSLAFWMTRP